MLAQHIVRHLIELRLAVAQPDVLAKFYGRPLDGTRSITELANDLDQTIRGVVPPIVTGGDPRQAGSIQTEYATPADFLRKVTADVRASHAGA